MGIFLLLYENKKNKQYPLGGHCLPFIFLWPEGLFNKAEIKLDCEETFQTRMV